MEKRLITRWWLGGLVLVAAGAIVCATAGVLMLAYGGTFTPATDASNRYEFVPSLDGFFWGMVGLCVLGCIAAVAGLLAQLVGWIGALTNTNKMVDKTWFIVLLVSGLLGITGGLAPLGFAGMVAYLIAGPDGTVVQQHVQPPAVRPTTFAPMS